MKSITLYQRTKLGKISFKKFWIKKNIICSEWGTTCQEKDKYQQNEHPCQPMNVGKKNATTGPEQAVKELAAKIVLQKKKGYVENIDDVQAEVIGDATNVLIDLNNMPRNFVPCKPKKHPPKKLLDSKDTYGQKKRNGHCLILGKANENKIYSRSMEDLTEFLKDVPELVAIFKELPKNSLIATEFCFVKKNGMDGPRTAGKITRKKDHDAVMERYELYNKRGKFEVVPFDIIFNNGKFIGDMTYTKRYNLMEEHSVPNLPEIYWGWTAFEAKAKKEKWEGWVLRNDEIGSTIHYTMNGKASTGGSWKYKYLTEDDFVVTSAEKGTSGKQAGMYVQFFIAQYLKDGTFHEMGKCGPGKLPLKPKDENDDRLTLKELSEDIDNGNIKFPFVIEIEYQSQQEDSGALEFAQFQRVRDDKTPKECITDFVPEMD